MVQLYILPLLLLAFTHTTYIRGVDASGKFTLVNNCDYTVWPGIFNDSGSTPISTTGFALLQGESNAIQTPSGWGGRFWARTHCSMDSTGKFTCLTGDCGSGKIECDQIGALPPVTVAEFTRNPNLNLDFYDVSIRNGFNLPLSVVPQGGSGGCSTTGCAVDLNAACPTVLKLTAEGGEVVACKSVCLAFKQDKYCCTGAFSSPETCIQSSYTKAFKSACPRAYTYAFDETTNQFTCSGADYIITFCPSTASATSQNSSSGSQNQPTHGTLIYNGTMDFLNSGTVSLSSTTSTCIWRSRGFSRTVSMAIAVFRLFNNFF